MRWLRSSMWSSDIWGASGHWVFARVRVRLLRALCLVAGFGVTPALAAPAPPVSLEVGAERPQSTTTKSSAGSPYGRRVVEIRYKPASLQPADLGLKAGQTLSPENLSTAMNQLAGHLSRHSEMIAAA